MFGTRASSITAASVRVRSLCICRLILFATCIVRVVWLLWILWRKNDTPVLPAFAGNLLNVSTNDLDGITTNRWGCQMHYSWEWLIWFTGPTNNWSDTEYVT